MKYLSLACLLLLAACDTRVNDNPYDFSSRIVRGNEFKATMKGEPGEDIDYLRKMFRREIQNACGDKRSFVRGQREDEKDIGKDSKSYYALKADYSCGSL